MPKCLILFNFVKIIAIFDCVLGNDSDEEYLPDFDQNSGQKSFDQNSDQSTQHQQKLLDQNGWKMTNLWKIYEKHSNSQVHFTYTFFK